MVFAKGKEQDSMLDWLRVEMLVGAMDWWWEKVLAVWKVILMETQWDKTMDSAMVVSTDALTDEPKEHGMATPMGSWRVVAMEILSFQCLVTETVVSLGEPLAAESEVLRDSASGEWKDLMTVATMTVPKVGLMEHELDSFLVATKENSSVARMAEMWDLSKEPATDTVKGCMMAAPSVATTV